MISCCDYNIFNRSIGHIFGIEKCYKKNYFKYKGHKVMTYSMVRKTKLVPPTERYLNIVKQGYKDWKLNIKSLQIALQPAAHLQR